MGKQTKKVPQWIRAWASQRQKQLKLEADIKRALGYDGWLLYNALLPGSDYLLCRFNENDVEAIRAGLWELTKEAHVAIEKKNRQLRESGAFVPDSGFSDIQPPPEWEELYVRERLLERISKQEMQKLVAKRYGWVKWTDDPWGNSRKFAEWEESVEDNELAVWAVNETQGGRFYSAYGNLLLLSQLDLSEMSSKELYKYIGTGAANFLMVKRYAGWDDFHFHYPKEPLPQELVNQEIINVYNYPFSNYMLYILSIFMWSLAGEEVCKRHPALTAVLNYTISDDEQISRLTQMITPKSYRLPDKDTAFPQLKKVFAPSLGNLAKKYKHLFDYSLQVIYEDGSFKDDQDTFSQIDEGFLQVMQWASSNICKLVDITLEAKDDKNLVNYIVKSIRYRLRKAAAREKRWETEMRPGGTVQWVNREIAESSIIKEEEGQSPLERIAHEQQVRNGELQMVEEQIELEENSHITSLKKLGLPIDKFTPTELRVVLDALEAAKEGYSLFSKRGKSMKQYWGKNYDKNIKVLERLSKKQKQ